MADLQEMAERNLILKVMVGSHLYGTNTPKSDKDYVGVFIPDKEFILGTGKVEHVEIRTNPSSSGKRNTKDDIDTVLYSLPKFFRMAENNNPNIVEIFFAPEKNIVFKNEAGQKIIDAAALFMSKKVKHSFSGYAYSQKAKLIRKRDRLKGLQKTLLAIEKFRGNGYDKKVECPAEIMMHFPELEAFDAHRPMQDIQNQVEREIQQYGGRVEYIKKFGYDVKFASHLIRLLHEGIQLLIEGELSFPLSNNKFVRDIKEGKLTLDAVLAEADKMEALVDEAYVRSPLPSKPDHDSINLLQIEMLERQIKEGVVA